VGTGLCSLADPGYPESAVKTLQRSKTCAAAAATTCRTLRRRPRHHFGRGRLRRSASVSEGCLASKSPDPCGEQIPVIPPWPAN